MIGTSEEMLFYHLQRPDSREKMRLSVRQAQNLRTKIASRKLGEYRMGILLERLGCHKIRDKIKIPGQYVDINGGIYAGNRLPKDTSEIPGLKMIVRPMELPSVWVYEESVLHIWKAEQYDAFIGKLIRFYK